MEVIKLNDNLILYYEDGKLYCISYPRSHTEVRIAYNGTKRWFKNGQHHRDRDLPATEHANGTKHWYQNGKLHRGNDLPAIEWFDGIKSWYKNGEYIRKEN